MKYYAPTSDQEGPETWLTYIGAFVDTDTKAKLKWIKALLRIRENLRGIRGKFWFS